MKLKIWIYAEKNRYTGEIDYRAINWQSASLGGTLICETEIEFPEPKLADVINGQVKVLRATQQEIRAKCEEDCKRIDWQIGELLAIEDTREAE